MGAQEAEEARAARKMAAREQAAKRALAAKEGCESADTPSHNARALSTTFSSPSPGDSAALMAKIQALELELVEKEEEVEQLQMRVSTQSVAEEPSSSDLDAKILEVEQREKKRLKDMEKRLIESQKEIDRLTAQLKNTASSPSPPVRSSSPRKAKASEVEGSPSTPDIRSIPSDAALLKMSYK